MKTLIRILVAATIVMFGGCSFEAPKPKSEDIAALRAIINIPPAVKSARWDIFGTPETTGWTIPGPTDFHTLVAELDQDEDWFSPLKEPTGDIFIVPEAARPWLSREFRELLQKNKTSRANLSSQADCRKYSTTVTQSGRPLDGFVCRSSKRILMYLPLDPPSN
ncbi:hypothetical protein [Pseudoduganella sp. HUAS MS19]